MVKKNTTPPLIMSAWDTPPPYSTTIFRTACPDSQVIRIM